MCVSFFHADECFSKLLIKNQSRAFSTVVFKWFGDKVVPEIGLQRSRKKVNVDRWVEPIHRWIDWSLLYYNFYNA
jgi:hypothetical protein